MTPSLTFRLIFRTDTGKLVPFTLRRPRPNLAPMQIQMVMEDIIDTGAVDTGGRGELASIAQAYSVERSSIDFDVA
jgi:hypothetical protein